MKSAGFLETLDDAINPIVVKELRQAVRSRFVVAVVLLFLILQILLVGIYLTVVGVGGRLESIDFQAGRDVFMWLQAILLATCMLFLPAYTGARLAAERSEVNTDLLFITTLQPRKIISGKLASAVILAILIFSACAPFMAFTYFLRGIDLVSIFFVVAMDFFVVLGSVHLMVFLAVIPANRVLKAFLGVIGFAALLFIFGMTLTGTIALALEGLAVVFDSRDFWAICGTIFIGYLGMCGLLYTWSVGLISAPSANRALAMRIYMLGYCLVSGGAAAWFSQMLGNENPFTIWPFSTGILILLCLLIAINERERWSPRVTRTIPKNWLLRLPAFLVYSGAAGGVLFAGLLMAMLWLGVLLFPKFTGITSLPISENIFLTMAVIDLYIYCYALSAILVRRWLFRAVPSSFTWVLVIFLLAIGSLVPILISFLLFFQHWRYDAQFHWFLANPVAAILEVAGRTLGPHWQDYMIFAASWAGLVTLLNLPWFARQLLAFRPYDGSGVVAVPAPMDGSSSVTHPLSK
jgi:hypothetical protein